MEPIQIVTTIIFLATIFLVIVRWIDSVVAAMLGVVAMVMFGSMTEVEAFQFVDWNVIAILVSIWLIAGYFGKTGIPEYLATVLGAGVVRNPGQQPHYRRCTRPLRGSEHG